MCGNRACLAHCKWLFLGDEAPIGLRDTISYQVTEPQPHIAEVVEAVDDVATTGPAAKHTPTDDDAVSE